jgi:hypothetical protein
MMLLTMRGNSSAVVLSHLLHGHCCIALPLHQPDQQLPQPVQLHAVIHWRVALSDANHNGGTAVEGPSLQVDSSALLHHTEEAGQN